ncbi:alpha/beta hydrolase [Neobacillus sp. DY30]|uniref:alpha/beta hydrolase n=1 Tax=Neobacillus sp. DY30 TaxID=3047871 RepID=UPI0024C062BB|nr:alpha/beta hydrolase [Neobacillus sp. DY30]WHY02877.1 alpha/beta hydrolase [Neobacillus sp. DY30]
MLHEKIEITHEQDTATLYTYILDNSPDIDANRKRPMIVICPGGGYRFTSDREAEPVAIRLNGMGFHTCILRYSVKPSVFPTALCQLAKAVCKVRDHAEEWNVDTNKIIVLGFSAGGHLAASLGVFWDKEFLTNKLELSKEQITPNGLVLCYPVITSGQNAHRGSFEALLGEKCKDDEYLNLVSLEKQVTANTPPTFLWHTFTDIAVPVENSFTFAEALLNNKVSLEMHIYPNGVHGLSLGTEETKRVDNEMHIQPEVVNWIEMAGRWIKGL